MIDLVLNLHLPQLHGTILKKPVPCLAMKTRPRPADTHGPRRPRRQAARASVSSGTVRRGVAMCRFDPGDPRPDFALELGLGYGQQTSPQRGRFSALSRQHMSAQKPGV